MYACRGRNVLDWCTGMARMESPDSGTDGALSMCLMEFLSKQVATRYAMPVIYARHYIEHTCDCMYTEFPIDTARPDSISNLSLIIMEYRLSPQTQLIRIVL